MPGRKAVEQIDPETGRVVAVYESITAAAYSRQFRYWNRKSLISSICDVCRGNRNRHTALRYEWRYAEGRNGS